MAASLWDARPDVVRSRRAVDPPICLECGQTAALTTSQKIYPRRPDLWNRPMWLCACGAYTACHSGTASPKGRPAAKATRAARIEAHASFDRLLARKVARDGCSQKAARGAGYKWQKGKAAGRGRGWQ